jgi:hypothetical protein
VLYVLLDPTEISKSKKPEKRLSFLQLKKIRKESSFTVKKKKIFPPACRECKEGSWKEEREGGRKNLSKNPCCCG